MNTHTPGPWKIYETYSHSLNGKKYRFLHIEDSFHVPIADVDTWLKPSLAKECEANAALIAAAPAMLEALNSAVDELNIDGTYSATELMATIETVRANLREALRLAEGMG